MKKICIITAAISFAAIAEATETADSSYLVSTANTPDTYEGTVRKDSVFFEPGLQKKRPWRAAVKTFGINVGVWAFDRYVMNEDFARINIHTIRHNIKNGFV